MPDLTVVEHPEQILVIELEREIKETLEQSIKAFTHLLIDYLKDSVKHLCFIDTTLEARDKTITEVVEDFIKVYRQGEYEYITVLLKKLQDRISDKKWEDGQHLKQIERHIYKVRNKLRLREAGDVYKGEIVRMYDRLGMKISKLIVAS